MRTILLVWVLAVSQIAQGQALFRAQNATAAATSVTINNHWFFNTSCSGFGTCVAPSKVISATGDTETVTVQFCIDVGCVFASTNCVVAITDGTNTYTSIAAARVTDGGGANWNLWPFYAKNATAGTYTITAAISACTASSPSFFYATMFGADFVGANTTTPIDASVSNSGQGASSAAPSLTAAGTVSANGSMGYAVVSDQNDLTLNGGACGSSFTAYFDGTAGPTSASANSGTTLKVCGTGTSGWYTLSIFAVNP